MDVLTTSNMFYDKAKGTLVASLKDVGLTTFPKELSVQSGHTGRTVLYTKDVEAEIAAEGWDGEEAHYVCAAQNVNAKKLVLLAILQ